MRTVPIGLSNGCSYTLDDERQKMERYRVTVSIYIFYRSTFILCRWGSSTRGRKEMLQEELTRKQSKDAWIG